MRDKELWVIAAGGAVVFAIALLAWLCKDGHGLTEAQLQNVACRDILGVWDVYVTKAGSASSGKPGAYVEFAANDTGGFANAAWTQSLWPGLNGCTRSGSTFQLQFGWKTIDFEPTSPDEMVEIDGGDLIVVLRRRKSYCPF